MSHLDCSEKKLWNLVAFEASFWWKSVVCFFVQILFEVLAFCESFRSVSWSYIFIALEEGRLLTLSGTVSHLPTLLEEYLQSEQLIKLKRINLFIAETQGIGESSVFAKVAAWTTMTRPGTGKRAMIVNIMVLFISMQTHDHLPLNRKWSVLDPIEN